MSDTTSTPPLNVSYLQKPVDAHLVNHHPLVRRPTQPSTPFSHSTQNPLSFLFHAAIVYPGKLALAHPDVKTPAFYSYSIW